MQPLLLGNGMHVIKVVILDASISRLVQAMIRNACCLSHQVQLNNTRISTVFPYVFSLFNCLINENGKFKWELNYTLFITHSDIVFILYMTLLSRLRDL